MVVESHSTLAGGGPIYWSQLSDGLIRRGHQVMILSGIEEGTPFASPNTIGLFSIRPNLRQRSLLTLGSRFFFALRLIPAVRAFVHSWKPDIIHTVPPIASEAALRAGSSMNVPVIASILSHVEMQWSRLERRPIRRALFRLIEQWAIRRPFNKIICLTNRSKQVLIAEGIPLERIVYIPHAVDTEKFNPRVDPVFRNQLQLSADKFVLGYAGVLTRDKGIDKLIQALAFLQDHANLHLLIAGNGVDRVYFEKLVKEKQLRNVTFLGRIDFDRMPEFMSSLDLLIVPSQTETLPTSLLEALATGTPVMATPVGGVGEFLQNKFGIVLPDSNAETIAKTIMHWLNRRNELRQRCKAGYQRVIQEHTWELTSEKTEEVYQECLKGTMA